MCTSLYDILHRLTYKERLRESNENNRLSETNIRLKLTGGKVIVIYYFTFYHNACFTTSWFDFQSVIALTGYPLYMCYWTLSRQSH